LIAIINAMNSFLQEIKVTDNPRVFQAHSVDQFRANGLFRFLRIPCYLARGSSCKAIRELLSRARFGYSHLVELLSNNRTCFTQHFSKNNYRATLTTADDLFALSSAKDWGSLESFSLRVHHLQ